jgi:hypothetical protein
MHTSPCAPARVNPIRQRKPPLPVSVAAHFVGGATRQDLLDGAAVLSITDQATGDEAAYWCETSFEGDRLLGLRLRKFGGEEPAYDLPADLSSCDCPDRTYRAERPGGCRHMAALRQALPTVTA